MGKANQAISVMQYDVLVSLRYIPHACLLTTGFCIVIIALLYCFFGTEIGASVRATGCNPNMARAQGINTNATKVLGLVISNGLVGLAGALYAQYQGSADINMGRGAIVIGLAAVIIGEVVFGKIFHNFALHMVAVVIGAIIYFVVIAILLQSSIFPTTYGVSPAALTASMVLSTSAGSTAKIMPSPILYVLYIICSAISPSLASILKIAGTS